MWGVGIPEEFIFTWVGGQNKAFLCAPTPLINRSQGRTLAGNEGEEVRSFGHSMR